MSAFARILHPLRDAATAFFKHDLALRRGDDGLRLVLQARSPGAVADGQAATASSGALHKDRQELALMRAQLAELLDALPGTRNTARHLAFVEEALANRGLPSLQRLPLDVLQNALEQIESMVTNWSPTGLANLRSKMAVAVVERGDRVDDAEQQADPRDRRPTDLVLDEAADAAGLRSAGAAAGAAEADATTDAALAAAYAALGTAAHSPPPEPRRTAVHSP